MASSPRFVAQLWVENTWFELYSLRPGGFPEEAPALDFAPVEEAALPELKRLMSSFLVEHRNEPMVVVIGNGDREYLFGPGQVGPLRFVYWE
ncbi:hypothetical protein [Streptomyces sp. SS]|uniref:hypothetical protein n=1 Tax=Streptomyces sp. SS TaxID=260742 RepID=UPI0003816C03|nr:hypothetical protein [Streptomyces sp. SS]